MLVRIGRNWLSSKDVPTEIVLSPEELQELVASAATQEPGQPIRMSYNESVPVEYQTQIELAS